MDLIYALYRKHNTSTKVHPEFESLHDGETLCTVSSQNIVAFTTRTELDDVSAKSWGSHVYVADLNTPWFSHKVISSQAVVTALEWDLPGHRLLVADASGVVSLWTFKEFVLNDWTCIGTINFAGEHIIGAAFFHNGKKIVIVPEKKDNYQYSEKFTHMRFAPSVRQFGGRPVEGCIVISTTGMVGALAINKDGNSQSLITTTDSLGSTRHRITAVDICYGKNGQYLVAVSTGSVHMPIQCFRVSVKRVDDKLSISSQALPSFFMLACSSADQSYHTVTQLKFVVREDADTLVVAVNGDAGSLIEIWELQEKPLTIHKLFQPKVQANEPFRTVLWQHQSQFSLNSPLMCMTTLKMALVNTVPPPLYVVLVLTDGTIHCLTRDHLKQVATAYMAVGWRDDVKHQKLSIDIASLDLTWLGGAMVVADTQGQLYLYRLHPISDTGSGGQTQMSVGHAASLLEYCLVTGLDWWDVLIALRPAMIDPVCDLLTEGFGRQPPATQQFHYLSHLSLRSALYRLSPQGQSRAADLTALLMLHSVSTAFKSLLRPSDLPSHDKGPTDSLQAVMNEPVTDLEQVFLKSYLEAKEFTVEPSTLQSLHHLIQWVADLALNLLARLPEQRKTIGYELVRDIKAVNSIRELLIIIRFWGILRTNCLPVFISSAENVDILGLLFKLLSRLVQMPDPDDSLIDECILLPNQVMIPPMNTSMPVTSVTSPTLYYLSLPLKLEFGVEPDSLMFVPDLSPVEGAMATDQVVDTVRHIYLGHQPLVVKQCCRCGGKTQVQSSTRPAAIRAWDLRWARSCRCAGHWRIQKYI